MISQSIALFRARKDKALAARIASEMVIDGTVERISWPLAILKLWMALAIAAMTAISGLILWGAAATHDSVFLLALPFLGVIYLIVRIWRGLNTGRDRVVALAKAQADSQLDRVLPLASDPSDIQP